MPWERRHLLIWGTTYPEFSKKYYETVCTGAVDGETRELVRIYPIQYRYISEDLKFSLYDCLEADLERNLADFRPSDSGAPLSRHTCESTASYFARALERARRTKAVRSRGSYALRHALTRQSGVAFARHSHKNSWEWSPEFSYPSDDQLAENCTVGYGTPQPTPTYCRIQPTKCELKPPEGRERRPTVVYGHGYATLPEHIANLAPQCPVLLYLTADMRRNGKGERSPSERQSAGITSNNLADVSERLAVPNTLAKVNI